MKQAKSVQHLQSIGVYDEWATPKGLLRSAMLNYDFLPFLDVCATDENAQFCRFFSREQNALVQEWDEDFFMNPPYSEISRWMEKAREQTKKHNVTGLILTFAKTDTKWWHEFVEGKCEVHFIKGRVRFLKDGIQSKNSAPYPSCWIVMRP